MIRFDGVRVRYGDHEVVRGVDLEVARGATTVLLGRSGSGKTTLLRLVNRMVEPSAGTVEVDGRATTAWDVIELRRRTGYVMQEAGLLPHYTVAANIGLVPGLLGWERPRIDAFLKGLNREELSADEAATLNFPLLSVHPGRDDVFRTTARLTETYDQIAFVSHDERLPLPAANATAGATKDGYDYGVFRFSDLFARALHGADFADLSSDDRKALLALYEYDVSDHLPVWARLKR